MSKCPACGRFECKQIGEHYDCWRGGSARLTRLPPDERRSREAARTAAAKKVAAAIREARAKAAICGGDDA